MGFLNKIPSQYRSYVNAAFEGYFNKISKAKGGKLKHTSNLCLNRLQIIATKEGGQS